MCIQGQRTDKEIDKAIAEGKFKEEDRDKAKGNCPVTVRLFWDCEAGAGCKTLGVTWK